MEQSHGRDHGRRADHAGDSSLDTVIHKNSASAEELAATAEELAGQARQLRESVAFFRIGAAATRRALPQMAAPLRTAASARKPPRPVRAERMPQGKLIELNDNTGVRDAHDDEFAA